MPTHHRRRARTTALATVLAIAGASVAGAALAGAPAIAADEPVIDTVDYLGDVYGLDAPVVEIVTFERFEYLLGKEGRFAFLIGGESDPQTHATIETIDEVAKSAGVEKVYLFDPKLDGASLDIRTTADADASPLWTRLVTDALSKDTQTPFGAGADPYLFVYDRSHTADGAEDRIVSALTAPVTAEQLADPAALATYRAQVAAVFGDGASIDAISQFAFYDDVVDAKHVSQVGSGDNWGGPTIIDAADADWRIQNITYPELVHLLDSDGDYVIFFGGTWCHNTRAVLKEINHQAAANDVETVYFFDLRLDGASGNDLHIRDTNSEFAHLYGDLVSTYLPNLKTQYVPTANGVKYHPGGDTGAALVDAPKLQVPFLFEYDRSRVAGGQPAPVARQWIRDNGDGTYTEYMTDWWFVKDQPGGNAASPNLARNLAFADEAIAKLGEFFGAFAVGPTDPPETTDPTDPPATSEPPATTPPTDGTDPGDVQGTVSVSGDLVPGGTITVTGRGLAPSTAGFAVELRSEPQTLGTVTTDASGAFTLRATIPSSTPTGAHTIVVAYDGVTVASASVTVTAAGAGLASTGTPFTAIIAWLGVALVAGAAALGLIARHRARASA